MRSVFVGTSGHRNSFPKKTSKNNSFNASNILYPVCLFIVFVGTPGHQAGGGWAETPKTDRGETDIIQETPTPGLSKRRSRWDETPVNANTPSGMTPGALTPSMTPGGMTPGTPAGMTPSGLTPGGSTPGGHTPAGFTPSGFTPSGTTPTGQKAMAMATPTPGHLMNMTPEQMQAWTLQRELDERNRPLSDDDLESMLPPGYKVSADWLISCLKTAFVPAKAFRSQTTLDHHAPFSQLHLGI